jgi:hypothetical protein
VPLPDLSTDSANDDGESFCEKRNMKLQLKFQRNKIFSAFSVDVHSVNSSNDTDATWEDNWLFKKRKLKTENQSIAMLVPSPTEEIKALIGDTNADETSDLSENSDDEDDVDGKKAMFTNTLVIEPKTHVAEVSAVNVPSDSLKSMQSLTSFDTTNPTIITEAKNNHLLMDDYIFKKPEPAQQINFILSGAFTAGEKPLGELTVDVGQALNDDEEFDSIVSPTQVREHKKSIDEQFEKLLMDDNNNGEMIDLESDIFNSPKMVEVVKR